MKITVDIENYYVVGAPSMVKDRRGAEVPDAPRPLGGDAFMNWAEEHLLPLTGTGRPEGDAGYFVRVADCEDPALIGWEFEWGV